MKKINLLLLSATLLGLVSCGETKTSASPISSTDETSQESSSSTVNHIDYYLSEDVRLGLEYKNKSFWTDGVEQVTLKTCIDGDTAHFNTSTGDTLKARFFGIDTPESTGSVEKWGKEASDFTKAKLKEASENGTIVISSPSDSYGTPSPDSTGTRYVSLVWINLTKKDAPLSELYLLNLWIVQEGLSYVKNVADMPTYSSTFYAAEQQAKDEKLCLFSNTTPASWNDGEYETVSLLDIKKEIELTLADSNHVNAYDNKRVKVVGTVAGYSNNTLYIQNFYTKDQGGRYDYGEYAGINIYTGMSAVASKYTKTNTYIQVCGLCQNSENFGFQLTDTQFKPYPKDDDEKNARVLISADDNQDEFKLHTFEMKPSELSNEVLNCSVELSETVTVTGGYKSEDGEFTLYVADEDGKKLSWDIFIPFNYHPVGNETLNVDDVSYFDGKTFNVSGVYTFHKFSSGKIGYQIVLNNNTGLVEVA
jgi:endonuclease YncB( thermonuclease family)